ncbi:MAG TPA: DUF1570 domain-containing protein [Verrucomicrobiota bacterium]|nr:DUF1570 domain-containing protein [Verrucomicrobiota bacterium]
MSISVGIAAEPKRDWRIFSTPNFELLTDGGDREAKAVLTRLERYRAAILEVQSGRLISSLPTRVYLILAEDEWSRLRKLSASNPSIAGIYRATPWQNLLAISSADDKRTEGRVTLHEYTHLLLRHRQQDWPLWMREGLAELLGTVDLNGERAVFGEPNRLAVLYLRRRGLMPMETLFSLEQTTNTIRDTELMTRLYAQSWAVAHYLKFALPPETAPQFEQFRTAIAQGVPTTEALKKQLNLTSEQLKKAISSHINSGNYRTQRVALPPSVRNMSPPRERPVAPGEAEAWLGDWALESEELEAATRRYEASLREAPDNFFGLLGEGRVLTAQKQYAAALVRLRQAAQQNPQSGWAQLFLGSCLLDATASEPRSVSENVMRLDEAIQTLKRATELMPEYPPAYVQLARAYGATRSRLREAIEAVTKARDLEPAALNTYLMSAAILAENGQAQRALETLDTLARTVPSQSAVKAARALAEVIRSRGSPKLLDALYNLQPKL